MASYNDTKITPVTKTPDNIKKVTGRQTIIQPGKYTSPDLIVDEYGDIKALSSTKIPRKLDDLTDVSAENPAGGNTLIYNSSTGQWEASAAGGGGSGLTHPQIMKRINIGL